METQTRPLELLQAIEKAGEGDLEQVEREIDVCKKKLAGLRALRQVLQFKLGIVRSKPGQGRSDEPDDDQCGEQAMAPNDKKLAVFLLKNGPRRAGEVAQALGIHPSGSHHLFRKKRWFQQIASGEYTLTDEGRRAAGA